MFLLGLITYQGIVITGALFQSITQNSDAGA